MSSPHSLSSSDGGIVLPKEAPVVQATSLHKMSEYGIEKGSYRSPYDYNIALGRKSAPASQPGQPGYLPGLGAYIPDQPRPQSISFGMMLPVNTSKPPKKELIVTKPDNKIVKPDTTIRARLVFIGPLRLIRRMCDTEVHLELGLLANFIDNHMADRLHTVVERDPFIPGIIYMVSIPMTDEHWTMYNQVLSRCARPLALHKMLASGKDQLDHFTGSTSSHMSPELQSAYTKLASGTAMGMDLESIMAELVRQNRDMWMIAGCVL